jgi:hypothetical protein
MVVGSQKSGLGVVSFSPLFSSVFSHTNLLLYSHLNMLRSIPRTFAAINKPSAFAGLRYKHTLPGKAHDFSHSSHQFFVPILSF